MQIEWPEKFEIKPYAGQLREKGWNAAIAACKESFDKAQGSKLLPIQQGDIFDFLTEIMGQETPFDIRKELADRLSERFGQPSPTPGKWPERKKEDYSRTFSVRDHEDNVVYSNPTTIKDQESVGWNACHDAFMAIIKKKITRGGHVCTEEHSK